MELCSYCGEDFEGLEEICENCVEEKNQALEDLEQENAALKKQIEAFKQICDFYGLGYKGIIKGGNDG